MDTSLMFIANTSTVVIEAIKPLIIYTSHLLCNIQEGIVNWDEIGTEMQEM